MKLLVGIICLAFTINMNAQNEKNIVGDWQFEGFSQLEEVDTVALKLLEMLFGEMSINIEENGRYQAFIMGTKEVGKWSLIQNGTVLELNSDNGKTEETKILSLNKSQLVLELDSDGIIFKKLVKQDSDE